MTSLPDLKIDPNSSQFDISLPSSLQGNPRASKSIVYVPYNGNNVYENLSDCLLDIPFSAKVEKEFWGFKITYLDPKKNFLLSNGKFKELTQEKFNQIKSSFSYVFDEKNCPGFIKTYPLENLKTLYYQVDKSVYPLFIQKNPVSKQWLLAPCNPRLKLLLKSKG